jgi:signal transduction histidine kinase
MPFMKTLDHLKQFDLNNNVPLQVEPTDIEEFNLMNESLVQLSQQNLKVFNQQKSFIENASHELQTPLAVLKSKIDILVQDDNLSENQRKVIADIELPLSRVSRINKNLLLLAKIENNQFKEEFSFSLNELLHDSLSLFADYSDMKFIMFELDEEQVNIVSNYFLMETVVTNLLSNAIKHTSANGIIFIVLNSNKLTIRNTGENELPKATLFDRFTIHATESTNSGLGLSILKEICNRYNWKIEYEFHDKTHSFSIFF